MRYARAILGAALSSGEVTSSEPAIWSTSRASLQAWSMNLPFNLCLMEGIEWRPTQLRSALLPLRRYLPRLSPSLLSHFGTFHNQNLNDRLGLQPVALEKLDRCPALYREQRSPRLVSLVFRDVAIAPESPRLPALARQLILCLSSAGQWIEGSPVQKSNPAQSSPPWWRLVPRTPSGLRPAQSFGCRAPLPGRALVWASRPTISSSQPKATVPQVSGQMAPFRVTLRWLTDERARWSTLHGQPFEA